MSVHATSPTAGGSEPLTVHDHARRLVDAGFSVVPIRLDGSKQPAVSAWKPYQHQRPTAAELAAWFDGLNPPGIAIIGGEISGHLEISDCDDPEIYAPWTALIEQECPGLIARLAIVRTPRPGYQLWYRCEAPVDANQKLARKQIGTKPDGTPDLFCQIETRGAGGYAVAPGSPAAVHPTGRPYAVLQGDLTQLPVITAAEREILLDAARALNTYVEPERQVRAPVARAATASTRVGDDYNARGDGEALLARHGWTLTARRGDATYWRRPGKDRGHSASLNYIAPGVFWVFSTNGAPFESERAYDLFGIYCRLEHGGDFAAAARELARQGYGSPRPAPRQNGKTPADETGTAPGPDPHAEPWEPPIPFHQAELPPFPTDVLPTWLRDMVEAEAEFTQTPADLAAMIGLACCALAVAKRVVVQPRPGWAEPLNLWTMVQQRPGTRKSQVFADMTAPVQAFECLRTETTRPEIAEASTRYEIAQKRAESARTHAAKAKDDIDRAALEEQAVILARELSAMRVPVPPRLLADDATPECLATLLCEQGGRMACLSPEGGVFELMAGRYAANGVPNLEVYLKSHAGDDHRVDRKQRPPEHVQKPALTLGLAVQPDVIRALADKPGFRGRGLLGRFLYSMAPDLLGRRKSGAPPVPEAVRAAYHCHLTSLLDLDPARDADGSPVPHTLQLAPDAERTLLEFEAWVEPQLGDWGELATLTDWAGKLVGAVVRLAGLLHLAAHALDEVPWGDPIAAGTLARAVRLGQYCIPHAKAAFATMGADPVVEEARHLLQWITRTGEPTFTKRSCFNGVRGRFHRVEAIEPGLRLLVEHGYIREQEADIPRRAGRPSTGYDVSPHVL